MSNDAHKVPSLEHVLQTLAYHVGQIMSCKPTITGTHRDERYLTGFGFGGYKDDATGRVSPSIHVQVCITPALNVDGPCPDEDPWGVWAQVRSRPYDTIPAGGMNDPDVGGGWTWHGNRCGGRDAYVQLCTPIVAWVALFRAARDSHATPTGAVLGRCPVL
jgi:hypothetical protein